MSTIRIVLLYLLYIVIIGGITTAIVLSLHSGSQSKSAAKPATTSQSQGKQHASVSRPSSSAAAEQTAPSSASNSSPTSGTSSPAQSTTGASAASAGSAAGQSLAGSNQLVNTGPGDVIGLFVGATIVGVLVHRRLLVRT